MTTLPSASESPFDRNRREERDAARRAWQIEEHRGDVFRSLELNRKADELEEERVKFETSQEFRDQVAEERAIRNIVISTCVFYVTIFVADLLLATPDVSRMFADKAVLFISEKLADTSKFLGLTLTTAPYWLRIVVGMMLVSIWLGITYLAKKVGNETPHQAALLQVQRGQDSLRRKLIAQIWLKRAIKAGYLVVLAGLFSLFYKWDLSRANQDAETARLREASQGDTGFQLPATAELFGTDAGKRNAESATTDKASSGSNPHEREAGHNLSSAPLAVYGGLWCLHFFLILLPVPPAGRELRYARFSVAKVQKQINRVRDEEIPLSLTIGDRVLATEDEAIKRRLFTITEPLIPRINFLYGRDMLILEGGPGTNPAGARDNGGPRQTASEKSDESSHASAHQNGNNGHASGMSETPIFEANPGHRPGRNGNHGPNGASGSIGDLNHGSGAEPGPANPASGFSDDEIPPVDWDDLMGGRRAF